MVCNLGCDYSPNAVVFTHLRRRLLRSLVVVHENNFRDPDFLVVAISS